MSVKANEFYKYDSRADTLQHIKRVNELLMFAVSELLIRARKHDNSKLESPEKELFDEYTPKLKQCTYGSDEYKEFLKELTVALDNHYANNSHHLEHYENGVNGFDLCDLTEMKRTTAKEAQPNLVIKITKTNDGWVVRIGEGAIPVMFHTLEDAFDAIPQYIDVRATF